MWINFWSSVLHGILAVASLFTTVFFIFNPIFAELSVIVIALFFVLVFILFDAALGYWAEFKNWQRHEE